MHNVAKKFTVCLWRTKKYFQQPLILFFMSTWGGDCKNMQEIQILWLFLSCLQFSPSLKAFVSAINYQNAIVGIKFLLQSPHWVSCKHHEYVVKRYKYFLWYPIGLGVMDTLCCISLRSLAYFWCKMPMFKRVGMR